MMLLTQCVTTVLILCSQQKQCKYYKHNTPNLWKSKITKTKTKTKTKNFLIFMTFYLRNKNDLDQDLDEVLSFWQYLNINLTFFPPMPCMYKAPLHSIVTVWRVNCQAFKYEYTFILMHSLAWHLVPLPRTNEWKINWGPFKCPC